MENDFQIQRDLPIEAIQDYCVNLPIQQLAVFGSMLRDDFSEQSDIDLLIDYDGDAQISLLDMAQQELELTALIGRKVDLRTPHELSAYFRQDVLEIALVIYERK